MQAFIGVGDGNYYCIGGTNGFQYSNKVHRARICSKKTSSTPGDASAQNVIKWSPIIIDQGPLPGPRYRHEVALHKDLILIFGGGTSSTVFDFVTVRHPYRDIFFVNSAISIQLTRQYGPLTSTFS